MKKILLAGLAMGLLSICMTSLCLATPTTWSYNGHTYEVVTSQSISWDAARTSAQAKGTGWDLATITSLNEQNFITSLIGPPNGSLIEYYIGGWYTNGAWGWITNEPFVFTYWWAGEPNGNAYEPRIALDGRYGTNWGWNDYTGAGASFVAGYVAELHTTPAPEPGTLLLLGSGLVGLGLWGKKRK